MKSRILTALALLVGSTTLAYGHDLFVKMNDYFVEPNSTITIPVLNGLFDVSSNAIMANRLLDISVVSPAGRRHIDTTQWSGDTALADTTYLTLETQSPGTYLIGASTKVNGIALVGADFNDYLESDGIPDVLRARRINDELDKDVVERYEKHIKAVFQVGDRPDAPKTWWQFWKDDTELAYLTQLGYPAEIIPMVNPYLLEVGDEFQARVLVDGLPVANQYVVAGGEGSGGLFPKKNTRSDAEGLVTFVMDEPGKWYLEFINMVPTTEDGADYHSKWATLTFAIR